MNLTHLSTSSLPSFVPGDPEGFSYGGLLTRERSTGALWMATRAGRLVQLRPNGSQWIDGHSRLPIPLPGAGYSRAGVLVDGERAIWSASIYYDANNIQRVGHYIDGKWCTLGLPDRQGYIAGYMAWVPEKWRDELGDFLTGQSGIPIISRTSYGPSVFGAWLDLSFVKHLIHYPPEHQTLGPYEGGGELFNETMQIKGVAVIDDSIVFAGTIGLGPRCYGNGTKDPSQHDTTINGEHFCYDPEFSDKGGHAYPYRYQLWVYPIDAVLKSEPWALTPTIIQLTGFLPGQTRLAGMAYDDYTRTLYLSQYAAENNDRVGGYPVVQSYRVEPATVTEPLPPVVVPEPTIEQRLGRMESELVALRMYLRGTP